MSAQINSTIKEAFTKESTEHLLELWETNDLNTYSSDAFAVIGELLVERGVALPAQRTPPPRIPGRSSLISRGVIIVGIGAIIAIAVDQVRRSLNIPDIIDHWLSATSGAVILWGLGCIIVGFIKRVTLKAR